MSTLADAPAFLVPSQVLPIEGFWRHWQALDIEVVCPRPPDFSIDFSLAGRVRSALGPALRDLAARPGRHLARRQRLYGLPSAFDAFFGEPLIAPVPTGDLFHNPTRPFLLQAWGQRNRVHLRLRLFGRGGVWQQEAAAGLLEALRRGIQLAPGVRSKAGMMVESVTRRTWRPTLPIGPINRVSFNVLSPIAFERRDAIAIDRDMLFGSILSRIAGIAAWHGILLEGSWARLADEAMSASIDTDGLRPIAWDRRSYRQHGRIIQMRGLVGRLDLRGQFEHWLSMLALVPSSCLGSHTTLGLGACEVGFEVENFPDGL